MKLPSLQELKRLGQAALSKGLDPSALERGLQYLREGGFESLEVAILGAKGFQIEFTLSEPAKTKIEMTTPSQPLYSECNCSMAGYGIFCKHQSIATWVTTVLASQKYELTRVDEVIFEKIKTFEGAFLKLKASPPPETSSNTILHRDQGYVTHAPSSVTFKGLVFCFQNQPIQASHRSIELNETLPASQSHHDFLLPISLHSRPGFLELKFESTLRSAEGFRLKFRNQN